MHDHRNPRPGVDLREHAVHLLMQAAPLAGMGLHEARVVVDAMRPLHLLADTLLFEEGDAVDNDYMVLVLDGQLRVVSSNGVPGDEVVISVIAPGSLVGEMGVIDGGPRSASCTALTDVKLGVLSRTSLLELIETHPGAAARLMLGVAKGLAERLREGNRRLRTLSRVTRALQSELDAAHAVNRRLLDAQGRR
ncbi:MULTISPECIES: cyclic nucleotide-binding domain-containing protein [unclassified Variovorax]|uniref:cyclic nucleotide-binding domain-containing protein n=1 Tax=unclassified Variovorax TaxID=663243 RepID=UPI00088910D5|nr:cyclic nucleotide-binding domain-containing protein [Variovorax sp. CF079]SDC91053.1 Cyclic nucleotide-binding domain-containing protein [Variovorax sp. CF079]